MIATKVYRNRNARIPRRNPANPKRLPPIPLAQCHAGVSSQLLPIGNSPLPYRIAKLAPIMRHPSMHNPGILSRIFISQVVRSDNVRYLLFMLITLAGGSYQCVADSKRYDRIRHPVSVRHRHEPSAGQTQTPVPIYSSSTNGFLVPRNCNRIGVPGSLNVSRRLFTRYRV